MKYDDLLTVPYKPFGRSADGLDCYGLVIEMCRRNGTPLIDFVYQDNFVKNELLSECIGKTNVKLIEAEERNPGDLIEWNYEDNLHVGFLLDRNTVIHATFKGVRISPIAIIKDFKIGRVIKWQ